MNKKNLAVIFLLAALVFVSGCIAIPEYILSSNKDVNLCKSIENEASKISCVETVAVNTKNASICSALGPEKAQDCYFDVSEILKDPAACSSITDSSGKLACQIGTVTTKGSDNSIISFIFFILFFMVYPRLYVWQMVYQLETNLKKLDEYAKKSEAIVLKKIDSTPSKEMKGKIQDFMNFFISSPVDVDPYGIINKIDVVINNAERRINLFVDDIAPDFDKEQKANINMALKGAMSTVQLFKMVRHLILLTKRTNNLQFAMILQMQMPIIMKIAKAQVKVTKAFSDGIPIGDSIGPMVAASLKTKDGEEVAEDIVASYESIKGKTVVVMKSKGPGSRLGNYGGAVQKIVKKENIKYIITIDAAQKLEGEKTGSLASGVGIAMSPFGVHRFRMEDVVAEKKIDVDAIIIKQGISESSMAMNREIHGALENAKREVMKLIENSKYKKMLVIGVGNTVGVGNSSKALSKVPDLLKEDWKKYDEQKKKRKGKDIDDDYNED